MADKSAPRSRRERVFWLLDEQGLGLEIGPSYNPFARKADGYNVEIVDHLDTEALRKKYNDNPAIEDVDYVFDGRPLVDIIGAEARYDWIIASHVIEHVPDVIAFLKDCERLVKADGVISLVVPDKRYCFDHFRPHSDVGTAIDAHFEGRTKPSPGAVVAGLLYNVFNGGKHSFTEKTRQEFQLRFNAGQAAGAMNSAKTRYMDCHVWCFTPTSLRLLILDLNELGFTSLREAAFFPTANDGSDFMLALKKTGGNQPRREALLLELEAEMASATSKHLKFGEHLNP